MTKEEKIEHARELREQGLSYAKIGNQIGVSKYTARNWLNPSVAAKYRQNNKHTMRQFRADLEYREKANQRRRDKYTNDSDARHKYNEWQREYRASNPEMLQRYSEQRKERRDTNVEYRFNQALINCRSDAKRQGYAPCNATIDHLIEAYNECGACCQICGAHESELAKRLSVDHCHLTGLFRGCLCNPCNTAIGRLSDNPFAAFAYLDPDLSTLCVKLYTRFNSPKG